jgi:adenine phosphoribosyltransferase
MISQEERVKILSQTLKFFKDHPKPGVNFCDIMPIFADPVALHHVIDAFETMLHGVEFDKVVGLESRGFLFGVALAYKMNKPFVPIRKPGKLCGEVVRVSYDLEYGKDTVELQK